MRPMLSPVVWTIVAAILISLSFGAWQCEPEPAPCPDGDLRPWVDRCLAPGQCFACPHSEMLVCR